MTGADEVRLEILEMAGEVGVKWIRRLLQEGRIPKEWRMGLILLYADDLALVANGKQELQETLEEWNGLFTRYGLKINVEKTEVLHTRGKSWTSSWMGRN